MNPDLEKLQPYPFERLNALRAGLKPVGKPPLSLALGEPQHETPEVITSALTFAVEGLCRYPLTRGSAALREAIAAWLIARFSLPPATLDPERHVLPVNGTREALFAFAQCVVDRRREALVLLPNPFYQIYEGAALLAGATPWYLNCTSDNGFIPNFEAVPEDVWQRCQLLYVCSPGNPTGAVLGLDNFARVLELADRYDFLIAADECYSEIYADEHDPPPGLLQAAAQLGRLDYRRCLVFHSLSKRSNAPGLRSGFVAGDADVIANFLRYRTYHGCAMAPPTQAASTQAWRDESHVRANRLRYREKFARVYNHLAAVLGLELPPASFYLWAETPVDDAVFARALYASTNVSVLPGSYLSREAHGINPGYRRVRIALVPTLEACVDAADRIRKFVQTNY